jgi:type III secretion protein V
MPWSRVWCPSWSSLQRLTDVLRRLLREDIRFKNMRAILEALAEWGAFENDPVYLTEYVRMNLKHYIAFKHTGGRPLLSVWLLDPQIESGRAAGASSSRPRAARCRSTRRSLPADPPGFPQGPDRAPAIAPIPIVLTQMELRYFVKRMLEFEFPQVIVLSFQELPSELQIQPVGRIVMQRSSLERGVS